MLSHITSWTAATLRIALRLQLHPQEWMFLYSWYSTRHTDLSFCPQNFENCPTRSLKDQTDLIETHLNALQHEKEWYCLISIIYHTGSQITYVRLSIGFWVIILDWGIFCPSPVHGGVGRTTRGGGRSCPFVWPQNVIFFRRFFHTWGHMRMRVNYSKTRLWNISDIQIWWPCSWLFSSYWPNWGCCKLRGTDLPNHGLSAESVRKL